MPDPDLEIREEPLSNFSFFAPQFGHGLLVWSKNKRDGGGGGGASPTLPLDPPLQTINTTKTY